MIASPLRFDWRDFAARNVIFLVLLAIVAANTALTPNSRRRATSRSR